MVSSFPLAEVVMKLFMKNIIPKNDIFIFGDLSYLQN